uniref:Tail assembly chaperone n=1 Tax=Mycobacterium phage Wildflower TaxID=3141619 RepID=A0AB38ZNY9_9VIRU
MNEDDTPMRRTQGLLRELLGSVNTLLPPQLSPPNPLLPSSSGAEVEEQVVNFQGEVVRSDPLALGSDPIPMTGVGLARGQMVGYDGVSAVAWADANPSYPGSYTMEGMMRVRDEMMRARATRRAAYVDSPPYDIVGGRRPEPESEQPKGRFQNLDW